MDEESQSRVTQLLGWGIGLAVVGFGGFVASLMGATVQRMQSHGRDVSLYFYCALAILTFLAGLGMVVVGLLMGAGHAFGSNRNMPEQKSGAVYVVAVVITDKRGEYVYDMSMHDPDDLRYFVQIRFPNGTAREFETAYEVATTVGEGLYGNITYQGKWLSSFERVLVDVQRPVPPRW
jgi:hypothetical protein